MIENIFSGGVDKHRGDLFESMVLRGASGTLRIGEIVLLAEVYPQHFLIFY